MLRDVSFHEFFHAVYFVMKENKISSPKFVSWYNRIHKLYGKPTEDVNEENMADNFSLQMGIQTYQTDNPLHLRGYLLTWTRTFCDQYNSHVVTDHGSSFQRSTHPLFLMKPLVESLFNCTFLR